MRLASGSDSLGTAAAQARSGYASGYACLRTTLHITAMCPRTNNVCLKPRDARGCHIRFSSLHWALGTLRSTRLTHIIFKFTFTPFYIQTEWGMQFEQLQTL